MNLVQKQRGSVTVIAVVMLLFLMIIAIAWLPMMTMEKTAASSDYREQQAWYAAEAGYKRAIASLNDGSSEWNNWLSKIAEIKSGDFYLNSLDSQKADKQGVWYATAITEIKDDNEVDVTIPGDKANYIITSVGSCQGIRKVMRKTYIFGDDGGSGGGDSVGEEVLELPGLVQAGGTVTVVQDQKDFNIDDIDTRFLGKLYGSGFYNVKNNNSFTNEWTDSVNRPTLKTRLPERIFDISKYPKMPPMPDMTWPSTIKTAKNTDYYWDLSNLVDESDPYNIKRVKVVDAGNSAGRIIFIDNQNYNHGIQLNQINGPESDLPVTFIFSALKPVVLTGTITGNVRMFFAGDFQFGMGTETVAYNGLTMFMSNGDMNICGSIWNDKNNPGGGFLSSDKDITIVESASFKGQIQCRGNFKTSGLIQFNDSVLKAPGFTVPKGMK